jgi:hypothetical protein
LHIFGRLHIFAGGCTFIRSVAVDESQIRNELADDAVNKMRKLIECWSQRLTLSNLRLSERYTKGEIHILVHFIPNGIAKLREAEEFCAVFQQNLVCRGHEQDGRRQLYAADDHSAAENHSSADLVGVSVYVKHGSLVSKSDDKQESVFVDVVKPVEPPEAIVPSSVRLGRADQVFRSLTHTVYFSAMSGFISIDIIKDRVASVLCDRSATRLDQLTSQVVQGHAQVADGVAKDGANVVGDLGNNSDFIDFLSSICVVLDNDTIRLGVRVKEGIAMKFEIVDVLFGPFDFDPDPVEPVGR